VEFGQGRVGRVDVTFVAGKTPDGDFELPSEVLAADKVEFGRSRIQRWFDPPALGVSNFPDSAPDG
jgi:sulfide:quinone oxidoreductase